MNPKPLLLIVAAALAGYLSAPQLPAGQSADTPPSAQQSAQPAAETPPETLNPRKPTPHFETFQPFSPACNCDGLTEADVRAIVREELEAFRKTYRIKEPAAEPKTTKSNGSTGGNATQATSYKWTAPPAPARYRSTPPPQTIRQCTNGQCRTYRTPAPRPRILRGLFSRR